MDAPGLGEMLTVGDVMAHMHVSRDTVLREIRRGRLRAVRFGGRGYYHIRRQDYEAWLATSQQKEKQP